MGDVPSWAGRGVAMILRTSGRGSTGADPQAHARPGGDETDVRLPDRGRAEARRNYRPRRAVMSSRRERIQRSRCGRGWAGRVQSEGWAGEPWGGPSLAE